MAEAILKYGGGATTKNFNSAGALAVGEVQVVGERIEIVSGSKAIAAGDDWTNQTDGVFEMEALSTDIWAKGDIVYWDAGNNRTTDTASSHKTAGIAAAAKASGATRALIDVNASVASTTI